MNVLVSAIVPVYNSEEFLEKCIESLRNQTLKDIEIIFINDGSTDNSLDILKKYEKIDNRIRVVNQKNLGPSAARNKGIRIAKGKYISFIDADDWIDEKMYQEMIKLAEKDNADIAICDITIVDKNGERYRKGLNIEKNILNGDDIKELILKELIKSSKYNSMWNKIYRKSIVSEHKIFLDTKIFYAEDWLFNIKFLTSNAKRAIYVNKAFYYYRRGHVSLSNKYDENTFNDTGIWLYNQRKIYAKKLGINPYIAVNDLFISMIHCIISEFKYSNASMSKRIKSVKKIINYTEVREVVKNIRVKELTKKEKFLYYAIKYKLIINIYIYVLLGRVKEKL